MDASVDVSKTIRLVLVDDHPLVRHGLRAILEATELVTVVGEASSGFDAMELAQSLQPELMLVDVGMRDMSGIQLTALLQERFPEIFVLMLSMYDNSEYVINAANAGARGYILKESPVAEIVAAIKAVAAGGLYYSASVTNALLHAKTSAPVLTEREHEVLLLLAHGCSNKAAAQTLSISVRTVESHRLSLRRKLGIDTPAGLLKCAIERGWVKL
jgi:two-component system nitrate/nitrite response regulator NarL